MCLWEGKNKVRFKGERKVVKGTKWEQIVYAVAFREEAAKSPTVGFYMLLFSTGEYYL